MFSIKKILNLQSMNFFSSLRGGFLLVIISTFILGVAQVLTLRRAIQSKKILVFEYGSEVVELHDLRYLMEEKGSFTRRFLVTLNPQYIQKMENAQKAIDGKIQT